MDEFKWAWICGIVLVISIAAYETANRICESRERQAAFENGYSQEVASTEFFGGVRTVWVKK